MNPSIVLLVKGRAVNSALYNGWVCESRHMAPVYLYLLFQGAQLQSCSFTVLSCPIEGLQLCHPADCQ